MNSCVLAFSLFAAPAPPPAAAGGFSLFADAAGRPASAPASASCPRCGARWTYPAPLTAPTAHPCPGCGATVAVEPVRKAAAPAPAVQPPAAAPAVTTRPPVGHTPLPAGWHKHECGRCGNVFAHGPGNNGHAGAHTCPACGAGPWYYHYTGPKPATNLGAPAVLPTTTGVVPAPAAPFPYRLAPAFGRDDCPT